MGEITGAMAGVYTAGINMADDFPAGHL